ncbi:MAG: hypothetical protein ACM3SS_17985 [Rhodospirillaceae bacterium]
MRGSVLLLTCVTLVAALSGAAAAAYPERPIRLVVPVAPGGGNDIVARIITRLNHEIVPIVRLPEIRERLLVMGVEPLGSTPEELGRHLADEIRQWSDVVRRRNIRAH